MGWGCKKRMSLGASGHWHRSKALRCGQECHAREHGKGKHRNAGAGKLHFSCREFRSLEAAAQVRDSTAQRS
eukprot:1115471-Rhodomonas_salina.3